MHSYFYSFIIPCYNEENDIENTLQACLNQIEYDQYEIIVIDDFSSDRTVEIVESYSKENSNIVLIKNNKNMGVAFSRNRGIQIAKGNVIIFINADEFPNSNFLIDINKHYENGADYVFPQTRVNNIDNIYCLYRQAYRDYTYPRENLVMWSQGFSCKKNLIEKVNFFDERYPGCGGEDWDLVSKIDKLACCRVVDYSIVVQHNLPEKTHQILWHMYNRGRGTAYNQLFNFNINRLLLLITKLFALTLLISSVIISPYIGLMIIVYYIFNIIIETIKLVKIVKSPKKFVELFAINLLNRIVRGIGYYITILKYKHKEKQHVDY